MVGALSCFSLTVELKNSQRFATRRVRGTADQIRSLCLSVGDRIDDCGKDGKNWEFPDLLGVTEGNHESS